MDGLLNHVEKFPVLHGSQRVGCLFGDFGFNWLTDFDQLPVQSGPKLGELLSAADEYLPRLDYHSAHQLPVEVVAGILHCLGMKKPRRVRAGPF